MPKFLEVSDTVAAKAAINADYFVNAKDFGAVGDGSTDDTDALQEWATHVVTNELSGWLPQGTYKITDTITFPTGYHWSVTGDGRPIIKQYTNNIPVLQIGTTDVGLSHSWTIENFDLYYNTQQTTSDTNGNCIVFEGAAPNTSFHANIKRMSFRYGYYAMKTASGGKFNLWGSGFDDLHCRFMSGGFYDNSAALRAGAPNNQWGNCTFYCDDAVGPMFKSWSAGQMSVGNFEFLKADQGQQLITAQSPFSADIGSIRLEIGTYTTATNIIDLGASCKVRIGKYEIGGATTETVTTNFSPASGQLVAVSRLAGDGFLDINAMNLAGATVTGTCVAVNGGGVTNRCRIGNIVTSGWGLHWGGGTVSGNFVTVDSWVNHALSDDKGDADYTVTLGDPNVVNFNTTFTAQRTITLPTKSGNNNCAGLYYDLVFDGAINGANTALIKEGSTTLRTQSIDGVRLRYAWRRSAWVLVDVADFDDQPPATVVEKFTTSGTWTKPAGAVSVRVRCIGAGGGGGAGARGPSGTALSGGGGGSSGGLSEMTFDADDLTATVAVTVGAGGSGAAGQTSDDTAGANGTQGIANTSFGSYISAGRGAGGGGGGLAVAGSGGGIHTSGWGFGMSEGAAGGAGSATGAAGTGGSRVGGSAGGGGGGGGITAAASATAGGGGGVTQSSPLAAGTAGSAANGGDGASSTVAGPGTGGGGGGGNAAGTGYDGGDGGDYGAGGGGGGAALNGNTSGAGGNGGDGVCIVTTYF